MSAYDSNSTQPCWKVNDFHSILLKNSADPRRLPLYRGGLGQFDWNAIEKRNVEAYNKSWRRSVVHNGRIVMTKRLCQVNSFHRRQTRYARLFRRCFETKGERRMLAVQGYYDGAVFKPLEKITAKPNQRVIITIMDEFVEPANVARQKGMRGALAQYADPALAKKEKDAWERGAAEKHGNL